MKQIIHIDKDSSVSKYRQIIASVGMAIASGQLKPGDKMPSINHLCKQWKLSRDTVLNAYYELRSKGIISSAPGKGFYVEKAQPHVEQNVFVLFDEINAFKEDLFQSFKANLPPEITTEIFFHHFNPGLFRQLLDHNKGKYTTWVIMPANLVSAAQHIRNLPGRVVILDQWPQDLEADYAGVYQNFRKDTYEALLSGRQLLDRYNKLIMVHPGGKEPEGQFQGFLEYCHHTGTSHELINSLDGRKISTGEAYLVIWDRDLVWLVKQAAAKGLKLGKDLGLISYNDTALKEVVASGITTISTDFRQMGKTLACLVAENKTERIENPSQLIVRGSL